MTIEITTTELLAKIGALTLEVEVLRAENEQLRTRIAETKDEGNGADATA